MDDLYIRFFRVAERRIAEQTGKGIICFISELVVAERPVRRRHAPAAARRVRRHHRRQPQRRQPRDRQAHTRRARTTRPSSRLALNPAGITRGTAVSLLVRAANRTSTATSVRYRDFWGEGKRERLLQSLDPTYGRARVRAH